MNLKQFIKLKPNAVLYNTDAKRFTTKENVLSRIKQRALDVAFSGGNLDAEKDYIYRYVLNKYEQVDKKMAEKQVTIHLKKWKLDK